MADQLELAIGHDNTGSLAGIHTLSAGLFTAYAGEGIRQHMAYFESSSRELDGDERIRLIGDPYCIVTFPSLTIAEMTYWNATLCGGNPDNLVTVRLYNDITFAWANYNAIVERPVPARDMQKRIAYSAGFRDVRCVFRQLEAL